MSRTLPILDLTGGALLVRRQLRVGGRGRVDRKAAHIADIGDVVEQLPTRS
jgi:hypothetical protein